jgi:calcium-dependent protein kinase
MGCSPCQGQASGTVAKKHIANTQILPGQFVSLNDKTFLEVYSLGRDLWSGAFGSIKFCTHLKTNAKRAVKIFLKDELTSEISRKKFEKEIEIMKQMDHPNLIKAFEFFEDKRKFYIVLEHCASGELFIETSKQKKFTESDAALIMRQIFSSLSYMHDLKIAHRDLKPENMLFDSKTEGACLKIIDFGSSTTFNEKPLKDSVGTLSYASPEVLEGTYNEKCDVWAAGVILYSLMAGVLPFIGENVRETSAAIKKMSFDTSVFTLKGFSVDLIDLLKNLLTTEKNRFSASQALACPWIKKNCLLEIDLNVLANTFNNLSSFESNNMLRNAVKTFIATQILTMEQTKNLKKLFDEIDDNGSGTITKEELLQAYKKMMTIEQAEVQVERIFKAGDVDGSGTIGYTEFIQVAMEKDKMFTRENIKQAFEVFDKDGNGKISSEELKTVLAQDKSIEEYFWEQMIHQLDVNGDGEVDLVEFQQLFEDS